jgi:photosystem II stability/assembly factor-like uncharacterized protein
MILTGESNWFRYSTQYGRGIFKSTDWGQTWRASSNGTQGGSMLASAVNGFAFSPNFAADRTVFFASWGGLFKSTDSAENWQLLANGMYDFVAVAPNYPTSGHMLARGVYGCSYRSTDFGVHWSNDCSFLFPAIAYSPNFATDNTIFVATNGISRSVDGGLTWSSIFTASVNNVAVSPQFGIDHTLFASGDALYKSTNGGATWIALTTGLGLPAISPNFASDHLLLAAGGDQLYRSDNAGLTWNVVPNYPHVPIGPIVISPGWLAHPYWVDRYGAGRLSINGWRHDLDAYAGLTPPDASSLALSVDDALWLTGTTNGIHASTDQGHTWFPFGFQDYVGSQSSFALSPDYASDYTVFTILPCNGCLGASIYRTTTTGATWDRVYSGGQAMGILAISPRFAADHTIFAGNYDYRVVGSTDGGDTWHPIGTWPPGTASSKLLVALPPNYPTDSTIFAANEGFRRLPPERRCGSRRPQASRPPLSSTRWLSRPTTRPVTRC